jgi:photosystem II stability/assembly factor-like uncharacterized protein
MNSKSVLWIFLKIISLRIYPFLLLLLFFHNNTLQPQWVKTNGPYGTQVHCITVNQDSSDRQIIYAGTARGIYYSIDNGISWNNLNLYNNILNIAASGFKLLTTYNDDPQGLGAFISTNYGKDWKGVSFHTVVDAGYYSPAIIGNYYFLASAGSIYRSIDNGNNWSNVFDGFTLGVVQTLVEKDSSLYTATSSGLYLSKNYGTNWDLIATDSINATISSIVFTENKMFIGTNGSGVFLSTNDGTSWVPVNTGLTNKYISFLTISSSVLFTGTYSGIFRSTDNGSNWFPANGIFNTIASNGTSLLAGNAEGIFISNDNGLSWLKSNSGLSFPDINSLAFIDNKIFAGTYNQGLFLSSNKGAEWNYLGLIKDNVCGSAVIDKNLFIGTSGKGILLSTDLGSTWGYSNNGLTNAGDLHVFIFDGTNFYAGSNSGVFLSNDKGYNWAAINNGLRDLLVSSLAINGSILFAGTSGYGSVYRTTNQGVSWSSIVIPNSGGGVSSLAMVGNNLFAGIGSGGMFKSTDNGATWDSVNMGLANLYVTSLLAINGNLFASVWNNGIILSTDSGTNWKQVASGIPSLGYISTLATNGIDLFAGGYSNAIWFRPLSEMITSVINSPQKVIPDRFSFEQNYPNPFNPSTVIKYSIPKASLVSMKVYDILGNDIATLVNENKPAGTYELTWNASNLPSGIYFYRIQAGSFIDTKKMILLK